jgi:outer membrane protein assembly factor BamB
LAGIGGAAALLAPVAAAPAQATTYVNWPSYLLGQLHQSYQQSDSAITPANSSSLSAIWTVKSYFISSPTVYDGVIYVGTNGGYFEAIDEATGHIDWRDFIGTVTGTTCGTRGFASTATVALDPTSGLPVAYVAAPDGYLYAFNTADGTVLWKSLIALPSTTVNDYFDWSSPTVANGKVYVGIASECDNPLVRGGLKAYDQASGAHLANYWSVPAGDVGGSIWSTPAVDGSGNVFVTTGNGPSTDQALGNSESIVELNGSTLKRISAWQISNPSGIDSDFGGSPTLFNALLPGQTKPTAMVGACNKNGYYYALARGKLSAGPVWQVQIGQAKTAGTPDICIAAAAFDGHHLFVNGPSTTIGGVSYLGSVSELDPANGQILWQSPVNGIADASPSMDGAGVIAVSTYDSSSGTPPSATYLFNAADGTLLTTLNDTAGPEFPQPVFADSSLLLGTQHGLTAYTPAGA